MASGGIAYDNGTYIAVNTAGSSGQACISGGSGAPTFGTLSVGGGGSGVASFANTSALITSGTTTTGALQNIASVATGQVLVSAGTSTIPAWSATPTVTSVTFGAGTALNSYVENTWTPALSFGGATTGITYTTQVGTYTRIGRLVYAQFNIILSSKGSATGSSSIGGLPYTSINVTSSGSLQMIGFQNITLTASYTQVGVLLGANATSMSPSEFASAAGSLALQDTAFANNSVLQGYIIYQAQ